MADTDDRLRFERDKWQDERAMRAREIELREREQRRSSWGSPLVVAIAAGALAALTNAGIAWNNARQQIAVEDRKAEAARILEVIKLSDAEAVRNNLRFLIEAGLINDAKLRADLAGYLAATPNDRIPRLPSTIVPDAPASRRLYLLAIGINDYAEKSVFDLHLAVADAQAMAAMAEGQRGTLYGEVETTVLLDEQATRAGILAAVEALGTRASAARGDVVMVHFSGHAHAQDGEIYLIPHEAMLDDAAGLVPDRAIALPELRDRLQPLVASTYVVLTIDACPGGPQSMIGALAALGMTVAVGGGPRMACFEPAGLGNGAFTAALLKGGSGAADRDGDARITVSELLAYAEEEVPRQTDGQQVPESVLGFDGPLLAVAPGGGTEDRPAGKGGLRLSPEVSAAPGGAANAAPE